MQELNKLFEGKVKKREKGKRFPCGEKGQRAVGSGVTRAHL